MTHKRNPFTNRYHMEGTLLDEVKHYPYLGVELSADMSWNKHINQTATKANSTLGLLRRNLSCCDRATKEVVYKALVRPILQYCQTIWNPHQKNNITTLDKIHKRAASFIFNDYPRASSVTDMLAKLEWEPLDIRRMKARLCIIYKESHGLIPNNIAHLLYQPKDQTNNRPSTKQHQGDIIYNRIRPNKNNYLHSLYHGQNQSGISFPTTLGLLHQLTPLKPSWTPLTSFYCPPSSL